MTYQEFFEKLSELEAVLYYMLQDTHNINPIWDVMYTRIRRCLEDFHEFTGDVLGGNDTRRIEHVLF